MRKAFDKFIKPKSDKLAELLDDAYDQKDIQGLIDNLDQLLEGYENDERVKPDHLEAMYTLAGDLVYRTRQRLGLSEPHENIYYAKAQDYKRKPIQDIKYSQISYDQIDYDRYDIIEGEDGVPGGRYDEYAGSGDMTFQDWRTENDHE